MSALLLGVALGMIGPAAAEEPAPTAPHTIEATFAGGDGSVSTWGHLRHILSRYPDFAVDAEGTMVGQPWSIDQRLRVGADLRYTGVRLATEWDLVTGQIAGETWDIPGDVDERHREAYLAGTPRGQIPRRLSLGVAIPGLLDLEMGLVPATTWGLGILANGGDRLPLFGRVDRGDRMIRGRFSFLPVRNAAGPTAPLVLTLGFDRVVEDDTLRMAYGQTAYHVIGSVLWRDPEHVSGGFFYTYRTQTEPGDAPRPTTVHALDGFVDAHVALSDAWRLRVAAEAVLLTGRTERVLTYADTTGTKILSGGAALEVEVTGPGDWTTFHLRSGWASASGDPDRGVLKDFTFDRNYKVGLILFDQLMGGIEAGTYALLDDRAESGGPPDGAELLVSEGSVRRATYLFPAVTVRPSDWMDIQLGYIGAWSNGPIAQPFYTFRNGGSPTNHLDQPTDGQRYMGSELDLSIGLGRGAATAGWIFRPSIWFQGGVAFTGEAMGGETLAMFQTTARVDW
ncbi:MAG: hypothetical protein H6733_01860 [Alphaproteobacteria bacterium]|nr:hypothetical protein [Alphaproteobacteria bacterium]